MPTNRKRRTRNRQNCPRMLWHLFIDDPLAPEDPDYNPFVTLLEANDWPDHKQEVLEYWLNKKTKPGEKKAIFLQREGLLSDAEYKLLKIKKEKFRG